jgi:hypothetical protein
MTASGKTDAVLCRTTFFRRQDKDAIEDTVYKGGDKRPQWSLLVVILAMIFDLQQ